MLKHKVFPSLFLFLFISMVTGSIIFLLNRQITPLLEGMVGNISPTGGVLAKSKLQPTPTMPELSLDMITRNAPTPTPVPPTALPTTPPPAPTSVARVGIVNSSLVNLRSYPSLAGEVVGQAKQGERLEVVAVSSDGLWLHVCCPLGTSEATQSWVSAEFIIVEAQAAPTAEVASPSVIAKQASTASVAANPGRPSGRVITGTVNGPLVNLRNGPDTNYAIVGQVAERTVVTITGRNDAGTWWRVCCPVGAPQDSWISANFVNLAIGNSEALRQVPILSPPAVSVISAVSIMATLTQLTLTALLI